MRVKLKINKIMGLYLLLILAIGNASLRFMKNGMSSFYRILAPLVVVIIIVNNYHRIKKSMIILIIGGVYNLIVSLIGYGVIRYEYMIFVFYIYAVYVIEYDIWKRSNDFENNFWNFLNIITTVSLILAFVQYMVRIPYPFVALPVQHGINLFMSNENELGESLGCMSLLYLYRILYKGQKQFFIHLVAIVVILFINDAKLTIFGCILGYLILLYFKFGEKIRLSAKTIVMVGLVLGGIVIFTVYYINPTFVFRDYSITLNRLLFSSIADILHLKLMPGSGGSLMDRTNAIIFGIKELINSKFLGIGLGNSVTMLAMEQYRLLTAKSMHNLVFQFLCELGLFAIIFYYRILRWIVKNVKNVYSDKNCMIKCVFIISFIIISSQSSIGILSNYYTWSIVIYIFLLPTNYKTNRNITRDEYLE